MTNMRNISASVLLLMLLTSSLMTVESASAQSIPKPSVPEFTAKLADHSYTVPPIPPTTPTYTIDPYSGKQVVKNQGSPGIPSYYVKNITIDLTIVNQPYPSMINGNASFVFFNVRFRGHFGQDWTEIFQYYSNSPVQSNAQYTVISLPANYRVGDQIDFQVQAAIGYKIITYIGHPPLDVYTESIDFQHSSSDWSPAQTVTIPANSDSPTTTPYITSSPTPSVPEFPSWTIFLLLIISVAVAGLLVCFKKYKHTLVKKP